MLAVPPLVTSPGPPAQDRTWPFFLAAFGITWGLQLPGLLVHTGLIPGPIEQYFPLIGLGAFGPLFAALLVNRKSAGGTGARALFRRFGLGGFSPVWFIAALLVPGGLFVVGKFVFTLLGGAEPGPWLYLPLAAERIVAMFFFSFGEEVGWRGYAHPRLRRRYGAVIGSVILGVLWGFWHLPMFLLVDLEPLVMAVMFFVFLPAGSVVFGWFFERTHGSLLVAFLLHMGAHLNNTHQALPGNVVPAYVHTGAYLIAALGLVAFDRRFRSARLREPGDLHE